MKNRFRVSLILLSIFSASCQGTPNTGTVTPTATASVLPSSSATPAPEPQSSPTPVPSPVSTSTNVPTPDIATNATLNGTVYDHRGQAINGARVSLKSLDEGVELDVSTDTIGGSYVFRDLPVGVRLQVKVENGNDWTVREQTLVLKSNILGNTNSNVVDFGDNLQIGDIFKNNNFYLSDSPEVTNIEFLPEGVNVRHYDFSFKMTFNKPVNKEEIEEYLQVRSIKSDIGPLTIVGDETDPADYKVMLKKGGGLSFNWNNSSSEKFATELTCTLSGSNGVYTSSTGRKLYAVSLRDSAGTSGLIGTNNIKGLNEGEFFVNNVRRKNFVFSVAPDYTEPFIEKVTLHEINNQKEIRVHFSEPMTVIGKTNNDAFDLSFYTFYKNGNKMVLDPLTTSDFASSKIIVIKMPNDAFSGNDKIEVEIDLNLKDPAGNSFSKGVLNGKADNKAEGKFD